MGRLRRNVRAIYAFDFPDDVYGLWELARELSHNDPCGAFHRLGVSLTGVFDTFRSCAEGLQTQSWLHGRSLTDPAEFFAMMRPVGIQVSHESRRWGIYLDDPLRQEGCVGSHMWGEGTPQGGTTFDMVRGVLEHLREQLAFVDENPTERPRAVTMLPPAEGRIFECDSVKQQLDELDALREHLVSYGAVVPKRVRAVTAPTIDGWGLAVPAAYYRPPQEAEQQRLWARTTSERLAELLGDLRAHLVRYGAALLEPVRAVTVPTIDEWVCAEAAAPYRPSQRGGAVHQQLGATTSSERLAELLDEGRQALSDGYAGTALRISKETKGWVDWLPPPARDSLGDRYRAQIFDLGEGAYNLLDRAPLARVVSWQRGRDARKRRR